MKQLYTVRSMDRLPIAIASGAFLLFAAATVIMTWSTDAMLGSGAGAFLTLAVDLTHGVFYRPLLDQTGIGGTRYFPLVFVLNAALIRAGLSPVVAGRLIALTAAAALVWAAMRVLEALEVQRRWAAALAPLTLCSSPGIFALNTIRGDLLPVTLILWGVLFAVRALKREGSMNIVAAIGFFVMAILAKGTAAYAAAAMVVTLALNGRRRGAAALAAGTALGAAALLLVANVASEGRMLESMRACMVGGVLANTSRATVDRVRADSAGPAVQPDSHLLLRLPDNAAAGGVEGAADVAGDGGPGHDRLPFRIAGRGHQSPARFLRADHPLRRLPDRPRPHIPGARVARHRRWRGVHDVCGLPGRAAFDAGRRNEEPSGGARPGGAGACRRQADSRVGRLYPRIAGRAQLPARQLDV